MRGQWLLIVTCTLLVEACFDFEGYEPSAASAGSGSASLDGSVEGSPSGSAGVGGSGGKGGSAATGNTSGDSGAENCTNGIDDNSDNLVDCADPQCSTMYGCVPPVPLGWQGYYSLYDSTTSSTTPECAAPFPNLGPTGWRELQYDPPTCTACLCGTPTDVECEEPLLYLMTAANCGTGTSWHLSDPSGMCGDPEEPCDALLPHGVCNSVGLNPGDPPEYSASAYFRVGQPIASTGSCTASGGEVQPTPSPTWDRIGFSCEADFEQLGGGGCTGTNVCAPRSPSLQGYLAGTCVYQTGQIATCPTGFPTRTTYYVDYVDTRDCTPCGCATPSVSICTGKLSISLDNVCSESGANAEAVMTASSGEGVCEAITDATTHYLKYEEVGLTGECSASGGSPTGTVEGRTDTAITFCCAP